MRAKQTPEEKKEGNKKAKEGMRHVRARQSEEERTHYNEKSRERMVKLRERKKEEDLDYEKIIQRQRKQVWRNALSGKNHLLANLKAKKGMQLLSEEGRLKKFERRRRGLKRGLESDDLFEWKSFIKKSKFHRDRLTRSEPDIVRRLNEIERQEKEL